jgi:thiol:disulfide interchange protein
MRLLFSILLLCFCAGGYSQDAVVWKTQIEKTSELQYDVTITGEIANGWYVYAKEIESEGLEAIDAIFDVQHIRKNGSLAITGEMAAIYDSALTVNTSVYKQRVVLRQSIVLSEPGVSFLTVTIKCYASNGSEFLPIEETRRIKLSEEVTNHNSDVLTTVDLLNPVNACGGAGGTASKGLLQLFFLGFIGGLIALLTPCVFPMIPVTVSFFTNRSTTKQEGVKNGLLYGLFIFLIYIIASVPFHLLGNINPEIFNNISTNAWVNVFFFAVFIFFALSFFGLFELKMPTAITNVAGTKAGLGSMSGIFFMALTLATVSFSCTGPILGTLLVGSLSSQGGAWQLTSGMGGFGAALALPFALFAMFPHWMKQLPKSGGWMDTVKKILAFVELGLAIKFLSNADLVEHWGILKREVFIGLWVLVAIALSGYLLYTGWQLRKKKFFASSMWIGLGGLFLLFVFYLLPGLSNSSTARLALLSGFPPPMTYSIYGREHKALQTGLEPNVINDYQQALLLSQQTGKPILIDFTGWACVNCRKMEEQVWVEPSVANYIRENFILVSLYVDDRKPLPASEQVLVQEANGTERELKTVGDRWANFQSKNFKQVTQPLYVILSKDELLLNHPIGYTADVKEYREWLECGVKAAGSRQSVVSSEEYK